MPKFNVPGRDKQLNIDHIVLDLNGTLAVDGNLIPGTSAILEALSAQFNIHVLTADTFGSAAALFDHTPVKLFVIPKENQDAVKLSYIRGIGLDRLAFIGNGVNDRSSLAKSALGIAVIQQEGASVQAVLSADLVFCDIVSALELFLNPLRLSATLRS